MLLVNEATLLPVLMPLAPASTLADRIADQVSTVLAAHDVPEAVVNQEQQHMRTVEWGVTANRSVVGVMTEFARLAEIDRAADPAVDLVALAVRLSRTPCGPLYGRNVSPERELAVAVTAIAPDVRA